MRRKPDVLLPIEISILEAALALSRTGKSEFHGYLIAGEIKQRDSARLLTAYGTLYKALDRLERQGLLGSRWEDPEAAAEERRPRRRLYHVTAEGLHALGPGPALAAIPTWQRQAALRTPRRPAEA